ncbi:hypothetical protein INT43_002466 [Umbelopsis isabellina]|uniref:non-specific serine/threonine protein kinase n=1 Tax=Mortierella isabellina TaxID=91625 RepID=A0A8H7Q680_MORIS|nr:hypothetical protein INT43_002466 [Umbelopsis isabellina]
MSSRRNVTNNENEQGNARHANSKSLRGSFRGNRSQGPGFRQPQYVSGTVSGHDTGESIQKFYLPQSRISRAGALVASIFDDIDDHNYMRRNSNVNQLIGIVTEKPPSNGDTAMWIGENLQLMNLCFHGDTNHPGLDSIFDDDAKASAPFKQSTIKLLSTIAEQVRTDIFAEWICERLLFSTSSALPEKERDSYKERCICLFTTLNQVVEKSSNNSMLHRQLATVVPYILSTLMTVLDTNASSDQIPPILNILSAISTNYPQVIDASFQDIIDLLMGWQTDTSVSNSVQSAIEVDFITLKDNMKDTNISNKDKQEAQRSAKTYFTCFHAILMAISPLIASQNQSSVVTIGAAFDEIRASMMQIIWEMMEDGLHVDVMKKVNAVMLALSELRKDTFANMQWTMYTVITMQKQQQDAHEMLRLYSVSLNSWLPNVDLNILYDLLDPQRSPIVELYLQESRAMFKSLIMNFIQILTAQCQDCTLQDQLKASYIEQMDDVLSQLGIQKGTLDVISNGILESAPAESLATMKHPISASTLQSRQSELLQQRLLFYEQTLLILCTAYPHIRTSCLTSIGQVLDSLWSLDCETGASESLGLMRKLSISHRHFVQEDEMEQFDVICKVLTSSVERWPQLSTRTKKIIATWIKDIFDVNMGSSASLGKIESITVSLFLAQENEENVAIRKVALLILKEHRKLQLSSATIRKIYPMLERSMRDPCDEIAALATGIITQLTPWLAVSNVTKQNNYQKRVQKKILASPHTGNFRPAHFEQVLRFLTMDEYLPKTDPFSTENLIHDWCQRLFHHCETTTSIQDLASIPSVDKATLNKNEDLLMYWVIWEAARYCMLSRMRTPCGGPQQTFLAFERTMDKLLGKATESPHDQDYLLPLRYLVLLIDRLELQIFNASNGNATGALPSAPRSSIIFFRANRKTCRDWFAHVRNKTIACGRLLGDDHLVARHSWEILNEKEYQIRNNSGTDIGETVMELDQNIAILVESLIRLGASDAIEGLHHWYQSLSNLVVKNASVGHGDHKPHGLMSAPALTKKWFWIASNFAQGYFEIAIDEYNAIRPHFANGAYILNADTNYISAILYTLDYQVVNFLTSAGEYALLGQWMIDHKQPFDILGIDIFNDLLQQFALCDKADATSVPTSSSLEILMNHMTVQQCIYFARLTNFREHVVALTAGSVTRARKLKELVKHQLSTKLAAAIQTDSHLKWSALTEMSLLKLEAHEHDFALVSWINQFEKFKRGNLNSVYKDPCHWVRLRHYLQHVSPQVGEFNVDQASWIDASIIVSRVCRWNKLYKLEQSLIDSILHQAPNNQLALYEKAKLLEKNQAYSVACSFYGQVTRESGRSHLEQAGELKAKAALAVARLCKHIHWPQGCSLLQEFDTSLVCHDEAEYTTAIRNLYRLATESAPKWPKVWFLYGTYCYRSGWQLLDDIKHRRGTISMLEKRFHDAQLAIQNEAAAKQTSKDFVMISNMFIQRSQCWNVNDKTKATQFFQDIRSAIPNASEETAHMITSELENIQGAIVELFHDATRSYRQYLNLSALKLEDTKSTPSMNVTSTLRLLRLLVKYGQCLQDQFQDLIAQDVIASWKLVIPQLFSRLNQPASYARDVIWEILAKIARESPKNIMYELIVGCNSPKTSPETKQLLHQMASQLTPVNSSIMISIKNMIEEMEKITVLWEEKWVNKIAMLQFDATERLQRFERELSRVANMANGDVDQGNKMLSDTYDAILMPVIVTIRALIKETIDADIKSPHEQWFQNTYGCKIRHAFASLEKPSKPKLYRQGWDSFQKLHRELLKDTNKLRVLKLSQLSPYLAGIKGTDIPMPGVCDETRICTIESFVEDIITLPTKTRPKKVDMQGSDGKVYSFLFKGLEDLHLDERIMQLISTINDLMVGDLQGCAPGMKARHFAVIPISDHSGMIQWVEDAAPLFQLYKRWQQRENAALVISAEKQATEKPPAVIQRPTEIFMDKISAALKREGLPVTASRRRWPKEILRNVYLELLKETPSDLLAKEVWCNSINGQDWWEKSSALARSMAVMSIIGYIIGLGDRHLDNTLVDFGTGEIVHIDFNVCFEKGKRLRVPELVPFRLTQNMVKALGITGPEGLFKKSAEQVLSVLQRHKEVLITLLDAFVYDPLFDWSTEVEENQKKQMMDLQANFGLLSNRLGKHTDPTRHVVEYSAHEFCYPTDEIKLQLNDEERVITDLLETILHELENDQDKEATSSFGTQQDLDETSNEVNYAIEDLKSVLSEVFPLLESIDIMQVEVDNELKIGQQNVKVFYLLAHIILASMAKLEESMPALLNSAINEENDTKIMEQGNANRIMDCMQALTTVRELFGAIRALEAYGTDVKGQTDIQGVTSALQQLVLNKASDEEVADSDRANAHADDATQSLNQSHPGYAGDDFDVGEALEDETEIPAGLQQSQSTNQEQKCPDRKKSERRNNHAVNILKRIRSKLDGIDLAKRQPMTVPEHVTAIIHEAQSADNLSLMYEGWTSWV